MFSVRATNRAILPFLCHDPGRLVPDRSEPAAAADAGRVQGALFAIKAATSGLIGLRGPGALATRASRGLVTTPAAILFAAKGSAPSRRAGCSRVERGLPASAIGSSAQSS